MVIMEANASDDHFALVMRELLVELEIVFVLDLTLVTGRITRNWDTDAVDDSGSTASMNIMPTFLDSPSQAAGTAITYSYSMMATDDSPLG